MDAELALEGDRPQVVGGPELTRGRHHPLGNDEQRDAAGAARGIGRARQHEMNHILGQIMSREPS